jgi:glycosyltransferase involved in cell wall biosynthesis
MAEQRLRIGLNLLHAVPDIGGGWNYIANLVSALAEEDRLNEYVAFVTRASAVLVPRRSNFQVVRIPIRAGSRWQRVAYEHSVLQAIASRYQLDCMHWFANGQGIVNAVPAVVSIYDLQPLSDHTRLPPFKRQWLRWRLQSTAARAPMLLPMSQATADELRRVLHVDSARMTVVPPILEPAFQPSDEDAQRRVRERYRLPTQFWLYVAHGYPHKNHERLFEAYRGLKRRVPAAWPLVLRGERQPIGPDLQALVYRLGLADDVIFLPRLERGDLPAVYSTASALVFPSLYEGAGIPVLEALACGCPVVASAIPPVQEFAGDAARYFDPQVPAAIEEAMATLAADPSGRSELGTRGLARARTFRETPVVNLLLSAYDHVSRTARSGRKAGTGVTAIQP